MTDANTTGLALPRQQDATYGDNAPAHRVTVEALALLREMKASTWTSDHDEECSGCLADQACDFGDWLDRVDALLAGGAVAVPEDRPAPTWPEWLTPEYTALHTAVENEIKRALAHCYESADASGMDYTTEGWISCSASNVLGLLERAGSAPPAVGVVEPIPMPQHPGGPDEDECWYCWDSREPCPEDFGGTPCVDHLAALRAALGEPRPAPACERCLCSVAQCRAVGLHEGEPVRCCDACTHDLSEVAS